MTEDGNLSAQDAPSAWSDADVRECAVVMRAAGHQVSLARARIYLDVAGNQTTYPAEARAALAFAAERMRAGLHAAAPQDAKPTAAELDNTAELLRYAYLNGEVGQPCTWSESTAKQWRRVAEMAHRLVRSRVVSPMPDSGKDARIAELENAAALDRKEADTWYSRAQQHKREAVELRSRITELERELADLRSGPTPRPTVEQLMEIGERAWHENEGGFHALLRAIASAVLAAGAPAVALPQELMSRLEQGHPVTSSDWDALYCLMRDVRMWARTLPTAPAITEGVREKAREIAYCVPASELMERFVEDGGHRPFGGVTFRRAIADACSLIRELAAGGTP